MGVGGSRYAAGTAVKHCTLYKSDRSPACRSVMMTLDALNLSINEVDINMDRGEHRSPELMMMNNLQTLPILKDRELVLNDSHAINSYLATRYCFIGRLMPRDPGGRSQVEQLLHYDSGILYPCYRAAAYPILYDNCRFVMPQQISEIENAYTDLENMLMGRTWFCGNWPMLADICIAASISTLNVIVPIDKARYPRLSGWLSRISEEMYYTTANKKGLSEFSRRIDSGQVIEGKEFKCPRTSTKRRSVATTGGSGEPATPEESFSTPLIKEESANK